MPPAWQLCLLQYIQQNAWYCVGWNIRKLYQYALGILVPYTVIYNILSDGSSVPTQAEYVCMYVFTYIITFDAMTKSWEFCWIHHWCCAVFAKTVVPYYNRCNCKLMKGTVEAGTFSLTTTCSQSFCCFVYNFVCIRDGLHTLRVMATLGVGGTCTFLLETTPLQTHYLLCICLRTPMLQLTDEQKLSENIGYVPGSVQLTWAVHSTIHTRLVLTRHDLVCNLMYLLMVLGHTHGPNCAIDT